MPWLEDLKFPRGYQMGTHIFYFFHIFYCIRFHRFLKENWQIPVSFLNQIFNLKAKNTMI